MLVSKTIRNPPHESGGTSKSQNKINIAKKNTRQNVNRLRPHEEYKQNSVKLKQMFNNVNYKRYFKAQANEERNLANINMIKANKQMTTHLNDKPKKVKEIRACSLLVEVNNEQQSHLIKTRTKLKEANDSNGTSNFEHNKRFKRLRSPELLGRRDISETKWLT